MMSRTYQRGEEFKARQLWLDFQDIVGFALQHIGPVIEATRAKAKAWFKAWLKDFRMPEPVELPLQLPLPLFVAWFPPMKHTA